MTKDETESKNLAAQAKALRERLKNFEGLPAIRLPAAVRAQMRPYQKDGFDFLCHLTKHVSIYPTSVENCREWIEVYERIADALGLDLSRHPLLSVAMAVTSPLQVHGLNVEIMNLAIEYGFPIISTVCPMAGTTSPYSVAGTVLLSNVEALAPVLIAQACKPGHPVLYGFGPSATDLRTGHDLYYKAEKALFKGMARQLGKFYNLPVSGEAGGAMTYRPDVQNGAERTMVRTYWRNSKGRLTLMGLIPYHGS